MRLVTDYVRDSVGNVTSTTVSGPDIETRTETRVYDSRKRFVVSETNALGHVTTHQVEPRFGLPTGRTDPNNLSWSYPASVDSLALGLQMAAATRFELNSVV